MKCALGMRFLREALNARIEKIHRRAHTRAEIPGRVSSVDPFKTPQDAIC